MINEDTGGTGSGFFHRPFYPLAFFLSCCICINAQSWKMIEAGSVAQVLLQGGERGVFIFKLADADSAEWEQIMRDEAPDNIVIPPTNTVRTARVVIR